MKRRLGCSCPVNLHNFGSMLLLSVAVLGSALVALATTPPRCNKQPSPDLTPEDVISSQIRALTSSGDPKSRIQCCYEFASPANRMHTGPIEKFEEMIQSPAYSPLLEARQFLVGRPNVESPELVHLLLTVIDKNGNLVGYQCFLTKQTAAPYRNCWMTDAVIRVGAVSADKRAPTKAPPERKAI